MSDFNTVRVAAYNYFADHSAYPPDAGSGAPPGAPRSYPAGPETALPHGRFFTQAGGDTPRTDHGFAVVDRVS